MATRLDKIMKPIIKEKCDKAFAKGYKMGFEAGGKNMALAYENEINSLKYSLGRERFLVKGNGEIIPLGPQWIPVTERLPQDDLPFGALCEIVQVLLDDGTVTVGWCNRGLKCWYYMPIQATNERRMIMNQCPECEMPKYVKCCHNCQKDGEKCEVYHACGDDCPGWEEMTKTNADRIRAMSDEELCKFLGEYKFCDICDEGCDECRYSGDCERRLKEWLKQPAEENR